jgi:transposase-like protein
MTTPTRSRTSRRPYPQEFVDQAVRRVMEFRTETGQPLRSLRAVSRELDIAWPTLRRWVEIAEDQAGGHAQARVDAGRHSDDRVAAPSAPERATGPDECGPQGGAHPARPRP